MSAHHGVSMTPGETALTRSGASSRASVGVIRSMAPLIAASPEVPGLARRDEAAVTKVIEPCGETCGSAACAAFQWVQNLA